MSTLNDIPHEATGTRPAGAPVVTPEQVTALQTAIKDALEAYGVKHGEAWFMRTGTSGPYWFCETATVPHSHLRLKNRRTGRYEAPRSEFKPAAVLNRDTGEFVRATIGKSSFRVTKTQPKTPPNIHSYTLNSVGVVEGVGYPKRYRIVVHVGEKAEGGERHGHA